MKIICVLLIALLLVVPAVFARARSYEYLQSPLTIVRPETNASYYPPTFNRTRYVGLSGIFGVSVQPVEPVGPERPFGKSWMQSGKTPVRYPAGYVGVGGVANNTPGTSRYPCEDFGCKPSQYLIGDLSTKLYYRCWCDNAKKIAPENLKCLDGPGVAKRIGFSEGIC